MTKVLLVDNHDSFTYNLVQMVREMPDAQFTVVAHNKLELEEVAGFDKIMFSPGPGLPSEYPAMHQILDQYAGSKSFLGVCLGHQSIAEYFGGKLDNLPQPLHGQRRSLVISKQAGLVRGLTGSVFVGLYHSWVVSEIAGQLEVTSRTEDGLIMSMIHKSLDVQGVQFHPESYMTSHGQQMIASWLRS